MQGADSIKGAERKRPDVGSHGEHSTVQASQFRPESHRQIRRSESGLTHARSALQQPQSESLIN